MKRILLGSASIILAAAFLLVLFRRVPLEEVGSLWRSARPIYILPAPAVSIFSNCFLAALKWGVILKALGLPLPFRENWLMKTAGGTIRSALPFRTGEAGRLIYLKRRHNFPLKKSAAAVLAEIIPNILALGIFIAAGGLILGLPPVVWIIPLAGMAVLAGIFAASRSEKWRGLLSAVWPERLKADWLREAPELPRRFRGKDIAAIAGLSLVIQAAKLPSFWLLGTALGVSFPAALYLVFLPAAILISSLPITFLGAGLREYSLQELARHLSTMPAAAVTGAALLFTVVEYLLPALVGGLWVRRFVAETLSGRGAVSGER